MCTSYPSPGVPSVVRLLFAFVTSAALSTTPQLHGGMTFVCMYDTLHPPPRTAAAAVVWYRAQSAQRTDCTKKKRYEHAPFFLSSDILYAKYSPTIHRAATVREPATP